MSNKILEKKRRLKEGEMVKLCYDEAFKIMYANPEHIETLTVLLSKILKVDYGEIEGKIELLPVQVPNKTLGEKKCERDVVVSLKQNREYKIVLEVNVRGKLYQSIMDRNLYWVILKEKVSNKY